ncbi:hypothetical protein OGAPHI_000277 [Ogataea philodendri]|uniref:Uncharacterized protein n=1 Tax=Ogataea philodendri TaxID=1378263 RepID=A0A9P8PHN4_9ASCO|nr:uncharacterized protein OGAPHI_000277 [Ogataea philodendri]KAH3671574.1 hypothetical protein OGAPHI_000277 [Ogataea philodendri]
MVRLKSRYLLFEILDPEPGETFYEDRKNAILALHRPCDPKITPKLLVQEIRKSLQTNFGDYGLSTAGSLSIKYFSNRTCTGIIRVHRENARHVVAALTFISQLRGQDVIIKCSSISGSIKKCEDRAIQISKSLMVEVNLLGLFEEDEDNSSNKEPVHVGLVLEVFGVLTAHRATVQDSDALGLGTDNSTQVLSNVLVDFLCVFCGGSKTGTNSPNRLVSDDDVGPVGDNIGHSLQLSLADLESLSSFLLLQGLTNTQDHLQTGVQSKLGLRSDQFVGLLENGSSLRVSQDNPWNTQVLQRDCGDFTGVSTGGLVKAVLGRNLNGGLLVVLRSPEKVWGWRSNHNLHI